MKWCYFFDYKITILILTVFSINSYSQEIETENWITDLNFLKSELPKKHKNLFFKITKNEFENGINNIIKQLDKDNDIDVLEDENSELKRQMEEIGLENIGYQDSLQN